MSHLRILLVEDSLQDLALIHRQFKKTEMDPALEYVDSLERFTEALEKDWDIIISDYHLPGFTGLDALKVIRSKIFDVPVVILSGALGEEAAVEIMRAGASDFILKQNLDRLPLVVAREVKEAQERKARKAAEQALQESEDRFRQLADSMTQLAWMARPDGHIFWYNKRWYEYTGTSFDEMEGWGWQKVHHPDHISDVTSFVKAAWLKPESFEITFPLRRKTGEYRWFLTRAAPLKNAQGEISGWFGTNTDIHDQKMVQEELEKKKALLEASISELQSAKEAAESANKLKTAFLANMSHEIRTPLGAILGFADLLKDRDLGEVEHMSYLEIIQRNGHQLTAIVNDILDLSKIEAGSISLETLKTSALQIVKEAASLLKVKADEKNLSLSISADPALPEHIGTDPTRLRQILLNVIGNAIKFTHFGGVKVFLEYVRNDVKKPGCLQIDIADSGIGMNEEQTSKLFRPFSQADESMTRKYGGTGLGLALSKRLAQAMGGDIFVKTSAPGVGSTFTIRIENLSEILEPSIEPSNKTTGKMPNLHEDLSGLKLLLVDDSLDNQHLIWRILSKRNASVEIAQNGLEAVEKALRGDYHLILMDVQMPVMDGYTATQRLRDAGYDKPIIALTAHVLSEVRQRCLNVGCTDHLPKPINAKDLVASILRHTSTAPS